MERTVEFCMIQYETEKRQMKNRTLPMAHVTEKTVNSTRRMLGLMNECQDAGVNTLRMLCDQGESLNRTEEALEEIDMDLEDGEDTLKRMSCMDRVPLLFTPLYLLFKKKPKRGACIKDTDAEPLISRTSTSDDVKGKKASLIGKTKKRVTMMTTPSSSYMIEHPSQDNLSSSNNGRFFEKITGGEEEDEMEAHLTTVSHHLTELKDQAELMGSTVTTQNEQLDRINAKADKNQIKLDVVNSKTRLLVGGDTRTTKAPKKRNNKRCTIV